MHCQWFFLILLFYSFIAGTLRPEKEKQTLLDCAHQYQQQGDYWFYESGNTQDDYGNWEKLMTNDGRLQLSSSRSMS